MTPPLDAVPVVATLREPDLPPAHGVGGLTVTNVTAPGAQRTGADGQM
jgi:hypothetical protein